MSGLTVDEVLVCDLCHTRIEDLSLAMFWWSTRGTDDEVPLGKPGYYDVTCLGLAHKHHESFDPAYWGELDWLKEPYTAIVRLAELSVDYQWSAAQWPKLVQIAWAVCARGQETQQEKP